MPSFSPIDPVVGPENVVSGNTKLLEIITYITIPDITWQYITF